MLAGTDPDFGTRDLFEAIERGDYPSWTVYIQAMAPKDAENFKCSSCPVRTQLILTHHYRIIDNILDLTKDWDPEDVPMQEIGKFVLTQNP